MIAAVFSFTLRLIYPGRKSSWYYSLTRRLGGPQSQSEKFSEKKTSVYVWIRTRVFAYFMQIKYTYMENGFVGRKRAGLSYVMRESNLLLRKGTRRRARISQDKIMRMLTNPVEIQEPIRSVKVGKALGPISMTKTAAGHFPQSVIGLLLPLLYAIPLTQHFSPGWTHARVISILKRWKDPALPST